MIRPARTALPAPRPPASPPREPRSPAAAAVRRARLCSRSRVWARPSISLSDKRVLFKCGDTFTGGCRLGAPVQHRRLRWLRGHANDRPIMHGCSDHWDRHRHGWADGGSGFRGPAASMAGGFASSGNLNGPITLYNLMPTAMIPPTTGRGAPRAAIESVMTGMSTRSGRSSTMPRTTA